MNPRFRRHTMTTASRFGALLLLGLCAAEAPVSAQVPGFLKKKAKEAENKATPPTPPKYDDVLLELTPERLDLLITGLQAGERIAKGPDGPAALQARREALQMERDKLSNANGKAFDEWDKKRRDMERCRDDAFSERRDARMAESQGSPEMMKWAMALAQANAKGDSAEAKRLYAQLKLLKEPNAADSAAVDRKCGKVPPPPPGFARMVSLEEQIKALDDAIRKAEADVDKAEQEGSKMDQKQLRLALERIKQWLSALEAKAAQQGYSPIELKALEDRVEVLRKYAR